jgi:hypothetical protein
MARRLFTVEDVFEIRGRGLLMTVLVPGIVPEGGERFRIGDPIILLKPDGSSMSVKIGFLEQIHPNPRHELSIVLNEVSKENVPIGTEVWSVDE